MEPTPEEMVKQGDIAEAGKGAHQSAADIAMTGVEGHVGRGGASEASAFQDAETTKRIARERAESQSTGGQG